MRSKKWKGSKSVMSLLLSAVMVVEPFGTAIMVHAKEVAPPSIVEEHEQEESANVEEVLPDSEEEIKDEANSETETDNGQTDNNQEAEQDSEGEDEGEDESSDSDNTDQKDESSEEPSDTEDQEKDESVLVEEETISGNELEEETVSENDVEEENQDSDTEQFTDMPEKYQLTATQRIDKEILAGEVGNINEADEGVLYAKGQVMVSANSREEAEMIAEAYNAEIRGFENGLLLLELQEGNTVASAVKAAASARNRLPAVWPNYYRYPHVEEPASENSNDVIKIEETEYEAEDSAAAAYAEEEGTPTLEAYAQAIASYNDPDLLSDSSQYQWQHVAVGSPYAWAEGYTGQGVKVAVIDTGVMGTHSELTLAGEADATGTSVVTGSGAASDKGGHGTHVAGIIGAKANNSAGGAGIAPDATLYAVNVLSGEGENVGTDWAIIQGIKQAMLWDVDVINMSLGGPGYNEECQKTVTQAYNKGIAIFVSAGNDGASCINYPAHYDHIICVAATDQDNSRADFSTYGSWVDLSAPGVAIWSTYYDGGYTIMDGTSMACPVAAGEAAVILSGDDSLKEMAKNGAKVDALEKKMKSNAVKVSGNGMGSGVTSLTKVFQLSTAAVKPQAPIINIEPDDKSKAQKVTVTITAQSGMTIYYTDNGKNPVYKNGEADTNTKLYTQDFVIKNNSKGTIKAIAVNESGVASAVKSTQYTLMPYVSGISISGVQQIAAGKSIQLTAEVLPEYATNKKLEWKLYAKDGTEATAAKDKISINASNGKITAKSGVTPGAQYTVRATATDGSGKSDTYTITVIENTKMKSARFDQKSITLSIPKDNNYDLASIFKAEFADGTLASVTDFKWSSNNKKIATVNDGVVQPLKAGKVLITALANDSSGKKATCTVIIKQQVRNIQISGSSSVAAGKSVTFKATILPTDVSAKKVTWSIVDSNGQEPAASTGVKINKSNGKLTTKSTSAGTYTVKASAMDDSEESATKSITIYDGAIKSIAFDKATDKKVTIFRRRVTSATKTSAVVQVKIEGTTGNANLDAYEVSSSNSGIATATHSRSGNMITLNIQATGRAAGKTNITLAATDGSGKKVTCAVTVNNPVTKVHISSATKTMSARDTKNDLVIDMMVIKGKSLQLKATLESEYGAISNKKVNWSINAPVESGISINKSGKVSAKKTPNPVYDQYIYRVTAEAADGSGAKADYYVAPAPAATYVNVPALVPRPGYINALNPMPLLPDGNQDFLSIPIYTDVSGGYIEATSSNQKVLEVSVYCKNGRYYLLMTAHDVTKDTMVTITVKATDGSGKKSSYKVLVTNEKLGD